MVWHLYTIWKYHHDKGGHHVSPCKVIWILTTIVSMAYSSSLWKFVVLYPLHLFWWLHQPLNLSGNQQLVFCNPWICFCFVCSFVFQIPHIFYMKVKSYHICLSSHLFHLVPVLFNLKSFCLVSFYFAFFLVVCFNRSHALELIQHSNSLSGCFSPAVSGPAISSLFQSW